MSKNPDGLSLKSLKRVEQTVLNPQKLPKKPGSYVLILKNSRVQTLTVRRLGQITFHAGFYAYVGSAMGGLSKRTSRYFKPIQKPHWHIDVLIPVFKISSLYLFPSDTRQECQTARLLLQAPGATPIMGFGSTDCHCPSHLFHFADLKKMPPFRKIKGILNCRDAVEISNP